MSKDPKKCKKPQERKGDRVKPKKECIEYGGSIKEEARTGGIDD
jgi:hypothetical protein